jgi:hypothetical protein
VVDRSRSVVTRLWALGHGGVRGWSPWAADSLAEGCEAVRRLG